MSSLGRMPIAVTAALAGCALAWPAAAAARPADVNIVGIPTVQTAGGTYSATVKITPASADPRTCVQVPVPTSGRALLQSVVVTDYFSPTLPTAYIKPFVKTGSATGQVLQQRVSMISSEADPTSNVRTGVLIAPMIIAGGGFSNAVTGEVYDLYACINHVSGESAQANFLFTGTTIPDGIAPVTTSPGGTAPAFTQNGSSLRYSRP
jgi:hypothetical protein